MPNLIRRYVKWLHTQWPAGKVEKLPRVEEDGSTNVPGLYVVGDLSGIPLLKFSSDTGARAVRTIVADETFQRRREGKAADVLDLVIVGAGVSGVAAAIAAKQAGLDFQVLEATEPFYTIKNFPKAKPIYTYPTEMVPAGDLQLTASVKEPLVEELEAARAEHEIEVRTARVERVRRRGGELEVALRGDGDDGGSLRALRVILAIGRTGNFRKLGVPGEEMGKVYNRLHDPRDFSGQDVLVVGGGDSAVESAIALAQGGARVTLSYRGAELSRPKPDNLDKLEQLIADPRADVEVEEPTSERVTTASGRFLGTSREAGSLRLALGTKIQSIGEDRVTLTGSGGDEAIDNDVVFSMIGREPPLDFLRRSGVKIRGETHGWEWVAIVLFFVAIWAVYDWKNDGFVAHRIAALSDPEVFPNDVPATLAGLGDGWRSQVEDRSTLIGTVATSMKSRSFYYTLLYTACIGVFGILRVRRRKTPYVKRQTAVLFLVQLIPLFLLPEVVLPWAGYNGAFDAGAGRVAADSLFELYVPEEQYLAQEWPDWGHPRAYWRAYGFILAWPLMVYNVFTAQPMWAWLAISIVQTLVLIPLLIYFWGKGAYCGWICSCGGLAETMGDDQRHKMPHGPFWNRLNLVGQVLLAVAFVLLVVRVGGWMWPESWMSTRFNLLLEGKNQAWELVNPLSWKWFVDVLLGGILGVGLYFKYSGRVWCRFACPLAALMHVYARFSRFRILADKKKCISCNACTSICHQGIDVMSFANKGLPMADPECVRCSACVQACPTGVLEFGQIDPRTGDVVKKDRLPASPVLMAERGA
jgi:thioredoxin reductase/ferredoxin